MVRDVRALPLSLSGTLDRFEIERQVAAGGMATVYRARDRDNGAPVALKVLHGRGAPHAERFGQEAQFLAELTHPAVVRYVAHGSTLSGEHYLAMEWLDGETLEERLERGALGVVETVDLGRRVADALGSAHRRGIVHRDIKPSNLFLPQGSLEAAKVLDFGLARRVLDPRRITQAGKIMGTPMYMAPEQARGEPHIDGRADIFALGCVLYECLAREVAFNGPTAMAVLAKICLEEPRPLRDICPTLPGDLEAILARMLLKERGERIADAAALALELERAAERLGAGGATASAGGDRSPVRAPASALTSDEQRMICVVLASAPPPEPDEDIQVWSVSEAQTIPTPTDASATLVMPESAASFDGGAVEKLRATLQRLGARLDRLLDGSTIVTVVGRAAPTDQAAAAARSALVLQAAQPGAAITISTGRAVIFGRLPMGEVIDRGAELLREVVPGAICVDAVTAGLLAARFEIRDGGPRGWRTLAAEKPLADVPRTVLGKATACVGRDRELALLEGTFDECIDEPVARALLVTAPAGGGKSRLRHELIARLAARTRPERARFELLIGHGDAMVAGSPFGLLGPAVRAAAPDGGEAGLMTRVGRCLPPEAARRVAEFLGELAGVPFPDDASPALRAARRDPRLMADQIRAAWLEWLSAECQRQPVLLVLDDVQWGDRSSLQLVDAALRALRDRPLMVVAFARPEVDEQFPGLWQERDLQRVTLRALTRRACQALAQQVLGADLGAETLEWLLERSDGNPFYLEELIRAVAAGARASLPETVLGMVQARLDALGGDSKRVLRAASIFGRTFSRTGVSALIGEHDRATLSACLEVLVAHEVISPRETGLRAAGDEYVFRHALLRDAAYAMLTEGDRGLGHLLAGEYLERADARDAIALVEHFERGGDRSRAARFCQAAAEQALEGNDLGSAIARVARGVALGASGGVLGRLRLVEAQTRFWRGEHAEAETAAGEAVSNTEPGSAVWFEAVAELMSALGQRGKYPDVGRWATAVGAAVAAPEAARAQLACLIRAVGYLLPGGRYETADAILARVEAATVGFTQLEPLEAAKLHAVRALRALHSGDQPAAIDLYQAAVEAAAAAGDARTLSNMHAHLAFTWADLGQLDQAEGLLRQSLAEAQGLELNYLIVFALINLAPVLSYTGRLDEARRCALQALELGRRQGDRRWEGAAQLYLSTISFLAGDLAEAESSARLAGEILAAPLQPSAMAAEARALLAQGRAAEALALARTANDLLATMGAVEEYESLVRLVLPEALAATGDAAAAREALRAARDRLLARAGQIHNPAFRESFLTRLPDNARTVQLAREWGI
jgi:tetratricopeptide (TPR) repeat protein